MVFFGASTEPVVTHSLTAVDWIVAAVILVAGVGIARLARLLLTRALRKGDSEHEAADVVGRMLGYVFISGALIYCLSVLGVRLGPLVGALGIGGLAIAFAAQSILSNFLASVILQMRRPFRRGDQISTNDIDGVVEDVNFRTVVLRTFEGERVFVPCADVLGKPITNHTAHGRRRTTLAVGVSYDADLEEARTVIKKAIENATGVLERPAPEVWDEAFGESTVYLAVRSWHAPDIASKWRVRNEVAIATEQSLDDAGIDMPFPVVTLLQQHQ